jgi:hypothetical protein
MTLTQIREIATTIIAVLAFGLSIYSLYLQRRDKRPRLNLSTPEASIKPIVPVSDFGGGFTYVEGPAITLRARNVGEKDIRLDSASLLTRRLFFWRRSFPLKIPHPPGPMVASGTGPTFLFRIPDAFPVQRGIVRILLEDETGNRYRSKWFLLDRNTLKTPAS